MIIRLRGSEVPGLLYLPASVGPAVARVSKVITGNKVADALRTLLTLDAVTQTRMASSFQKMSDANVRQKERLCVARLPLSV